LEGCELRLVWWGFFPTKVDVSCRNDELHAGSSFCQCRSEI
jgi:hypothetical protein